MPFRPERKQAIRVSIGQVLHPRAHILDFRRPSQLWLMGDRRT